jgi:hypothetical protein
MILEWLGHETHHVEAVIVGMVHWEFSAITKFVRKVIHRKVVGKLKQPI